jgi:hypothetical protein
MKEIISMKTFKNKKVIIAILILSTFTLNAISQTSFIWGKQFGTDKGEYALNHVVDQNGNIYVSGKTAGNMDGVNYGKNDGFITKIDSFGTIKWTKQFGTNEEEDIQWSAIDKIDCIYITGSTTGILNDKNFGKEDVFIIKYNSDGQMLWLKQYGTDSTDIGKGIYIDNKGYVYVTGITSGKFGKSSFGKSDGFIMKLDDNGNKLFTIQFGSADDDYSNAITGDNNSSIYLCGSTWGDLGSKNKGMMDAFTAQFTDQGNLVKFNQFGSEGFEIAMDLKVDKENYIFVGGSTSGNVGCQQIGEGDCFLTKINDKGDVLWTNQFGTKKHDGIRSIVLNDKISDKILISGLMNLPPAEAFIRLYKKDGSLLWEKNPIDDHKQCDASGKDISIDEKGYICLLGLTNSNLFWASPGGVFLVKLKLDDNIQTH